MDEGLLLPFTLPHPHCDHNLAMFFPGVLNICMDFWFRKRIERPKGSLDFYFLFYQKLFDEKRLEPSVLKLTKTVQQTFDTTFTGGTLEGSTYRFESFPLPS